MKKLITPILTALLVSALTISATAQKQPQIQEISVLAPANIKIDGKVNEWANPLLNAYNSTNRIYYVVSNDDNNLYLTVRGLGNGVAKKALAGGLTFTISHAEKKNRAKAADNVAIKFPVPLDAKITLDIMGTINQINNFDDTVASRKKIDSIATAASKLVNNAMQVINVIGVKEIPDSVISIYNTQGIKAAAQFNKIQLIIEIAIPLKYLNLSVNDATKFSYNIKLDAVPLATQNYGIVVDMAIPAPIMAPSAGVGFAPPMPGAGVNPNNAYAWNPTDFWGEYTLAKKP